MSAQWTKTSVPLLSQMTSTTRPKNLDVTFYINHTLQNTYCQERLDVPTKNTLSPGSVIIWRMTYISEIGGGEPSLIMMAVKPWVPPRSTHPPGSLGFILIFWDTKNSQFLSSVLCSYVSCLGCWQKESFYRNLIPCFNYISEKLDGDQKSASHSGSRCPCLFNWYIISPFAFTFDLLKCSVVSTDFLFTCTVMPLPFSLYIKAVHFPSSPLFVNTNPFHGISELSSISLQKLKKCVFLLLLLLYLFGSVQWGCCKMWWRYGPLKYLFTEWRCRGLSLQAHHCVSQNRTDFGAVTTNPQLFALKQQSSIFHLHNSSIAGQLGPVLPMTLLCYWADGVARTLMATMEERQTDMVHCTLALITSTQKGHTTSIYI